MLMFLFAFFSTLEHGLGVDFITAGMVFHGAPLHWYTYTNGCLVHDGMESAGPKGLLSEYNRRGGQAIVAEASKHTE